MPCHAVRTRRRRRHAAQLVPTEEEDEASEAEARVRGRRAAAACTPGLDLPPRRNTHVSRARSAARGAVRLGAARLGFGARQARPRCADEEWLTLRGEGEHPRGGGDDDKLEGWEIEMGREMARGARSESRETISAAEIVAPEIVCKSRDGGETFSRRDTTGEIWHSLPRRGILLEPKAVAAEERELAGAPLTLERKLAAAHQKEHGAARVAAREVAQAIGRALEEAPPGRRVSFGFKVAATLPLMMTAP